ncbi:MAG: hypothetical protein JWQ35_168 [Bacteriovoracaceae bacterium]|nr:hypothetical protein [Bacteriovoracaceae bacterium]
MKRPLSPTSFHYPGSLRNDSERQMALQLGLSRTTLRGILLGGGNPTVGTLKKVADLKHMDLFLFMTPQEEPKSEYSSFGASVLVVRDGFDSWETHFRNFVEEFKKTKDFRLIFFAPVQKLDPKLHSLLSSIVVDLCLRFKMKPPAWAIKLRFLKKPWFPLEADECKPIALVESRLSYRRNNIFVLEHFLERV